MVKLTRIYTRGGDKGQTSLGDGARIAKDDLRIQAGGAVDETNSVIGIARLSINGDIDAMLGRIQDDLFDLGADLCVPEEGRKGKAGHEPLRITEKQVKRLEATHRLYSINSVGIWAGNVQYRRLKHTPMTLWLGVLKN